MKQFAKITYEDFIINGEVNERLPLYTEEIIDIYPLDINANSALPYVKLESNKITIGNSNNLTNSSNVQLVNGTMSFTGNADSYHKLNLNEFNELKFKFNIDSLNKDLTIYESCEDLFAIKINHIYQYLYLEIKESTNAISTKPDLPNGCYRLTENNSIDINTWYEFKLYIYDSIIAIYLDNKMAKTFIYKDTLNILNVFLGKGFTGKILYLSAYKDEKCTDITRTIPNTLSIVCNIKITDLSSYDLFNINPLSVQVNNGQIIIKNNNSIIASNNIVAKRPYAFACSYSSNKLNLIIRDLITNEKIINISSNIVIGTQLSLHHQGQLSNLVIYKKAFTETFLESITSKKFSLDKKGNLIYELDEINGHYKLKFNNGKKYHLQLTMDLNSDCKTIINNLKADFVDGGVQSSAEHKKIQLLFSDSINLTNTWDIVYKTKITELNNGKHYDSLGEGLYWGIEDNKFVIKYINGNSIVSSFIEDIPIDDVLNKWINISITYSSNNVTFTVFTPIRTSSVNITKTINSITNNYDLFLGGKDDVLYGKAIYRDLTIINGWNVDLKYKENMFKTKISYCNNKLISNVSIKEGE